ncbi:hypothetical protein DL96DRAFT_1583403 [Flagelloscypha sp. PMI_526]|nr:hypothetical protein DL96DRAFT_1583403 [Flagelloscypha sp. PMI_526]
MDTFFLESRYLALKSSAGPPQTVDLHRMRSIALVKKLQDRYNKTMEWFQATPGIVKKNVSVLIHSILQPYADASEGKRLMWKLCLINFGVYLLWKMPPGERFLQRYGMHSPLSGKVVTMLTSVFSHRSFIHLLANCLVLEGFGSSAYFYLFSSQMKQEPGRLESHSDSHFLAFFISAGLFSSYVSHIAATKFLYPRMVKSMSAELASSTSSAQVGTWATAVRKSLSEPASMFRWRSIPNGASEGVTTAKLASKGLLPSLGASGALASCVMMTAMAFPEAQVALFIPPTYPFSIQYGLYGAMALDVLGVLRGWRFFDHYAHLGGYAFGYLYWKYGPVVWNQLRKGFDDMVKENMVVDENGQLIPRH